MVDLLHLRMLRKEFNNLQCVLSMTLYTERECLRALQENECVERRKRSAFITKRKCADICCEGCGAYILRKADAVVACIRLNQLREFAALYPVKLACVNDYAAKGGAVAADVFGCGVDNNVSAVFNRTEKIRCSKGVVNHQRKAVLMGDFGNSVDINDVRVRIADRLDVHNPCILFDSLLENLRSLCRVYKCRLNAVSRQCVLQEVECTAIDCRSRDNVLSALYQCVQRVGNSCSA